MTTHSKAERGNYHGTNVARHFVTATTFSSHSLCHFLNPSVIKKSFMGLHLQQMAPLVLDNSLLYFLLLKKKFLFFKTRHFSSRISSAIFTSDGASLCFFTFGSCSLKKRKGQITTFFIKNIIMRVL